MQCSKSAGAGAGVYTTTHAHNKPELVRTHVLLASRLYVGAPLAADCSCKIHGPAGARIDPYVRTRSANAQLWGLGAAPEQLAVTVRVHTCGM